MNKPIVATWGTGPTYRDRIKHNIQKAINTGYDNIMDYVVLTDKPDDFYEFQDKTKKIVEIINIHDARKDYEWSKELEFIPTALDQENYGKQYMEARHNGKLFSYSLNRFSLPTISRLGYTKFLMCDNDSDIRYDRITSGQNTEEEFWDQFNTPINSMKGCDIESWDVRTLDVNDIDGFRNNYLYSNLIISSILTYELGKKFPDYLNKSIYVKDIIQTEGPFRFYNFESTWHLNRYFEMWQEVIKVSLSNHFIQGMLCGGSYMRIDNIPVAVVNRMMDITPINFEKHWHTVNIYAQDRYFIPRGTTAGDGRALFPAENLEKFLELNKDHIDYLKSMSQWLD